MGAAERLDETFAALSDPTRRRVVGLLGLGPRRASEIADAFGMSRPAMSRHLRTLRTCGLVEERADELDARARVYRLRPEPLRDLEGWVVEVQEFWELQLDAFRRHAEGKRRR